MVDVSIKNIVGYFLIGAIAFGVVHHLATMPPEKKQASIKTSAKPEKPRSTADCLNDYDCARFIEKMTRPSERDLWNYRNGR